MSTQAIGSTTGTAIPDFYVREEEHHADGGSTMLGFWLYLMSDCFLFAVLFATYAVLGTSYAGGPGPRELRSEEHTSELQSLMRISYAVFCLTKKTHTLTLCIFTNIQLN